MKKLLLIAITLITLSVSAQSGHANKVKAVINKELYPLYDKQAQGESYMSSDYSALIGVSYVTGPYGDSDVLREMEEGIIPGSLEVIKLPDSKLPVRAQKGKILNEARQETVVELYLLADDKGGFTVIVSGYKFSDAATYAAEGKKIVLSLGSL